MKTLKELLVLSVLICFSSANAFFVTDNQQKFMPENNMWIPTDQKTGNDMTEAIFNAVIKKVEDIYAPIASRAGGRLSIEGDWSNGKVNATASRRGRIYKVNMYGGLARHAVVTADAFALVICHELGHHFGGIPKMPGFFASWASNEGQSDYYATLKCMRKVFINDDNAAIMAGVEVPEAAVNLCVKSFTDSNEQLLCQRSAMASFNLVRLLQEIRKEPKKPSFVERDPRIVPKTQHKHPGTQCRMDTYLAGALCQVSDTQDVSYSDESLGVCYRSNGDIVGARPLCWFRPKRK